MELLFLLVILVALDLLALGFGHDSRDKLSRDELARRMRL